MGRKRVVIKPIWGERVRELCVNEHLTQAELADLIFISQQTVSKICSGKASLTPAVAEAINAEFPWYSVQWLLGLSDVQNEEQAAMDREASERYDRAVEEMALEYERQEAERQRQETQAAVQTLLRACGYRLKAGKEGPCRLTSPDGKTLRLTQSQVEDLRAAALEFFRMGLGYEFQRLEREVETKNECSEEGKNNG